MKHTIVLLHAHPDDETFLTGGTLARWHAEGHRTVVVVATDGARGLAASRPAGGGDLASIRAREVESACAELGVDRLVMLGHPDSGNAGPTRAHDYCRLPTDRLVDEVAAVLREEQADAITVYDPAGGYGHRDHVQVHRVGRAAARHARTPLVLQATVDRRSLQRALRLIDWLPGLPAGFSAEAFADYYTHPADLTHRVDVRPYLDRKRAAMRAHASQASADSGDRTLAWCLRLPRPVFRRLFGFEWFVEVGRRPGATLLADPLANLPTVGTTRQHSRSGSSARCWRIA